MAVRRCRTHGPSRNLKRPDLHHHFLSDEMTARMIAELTGVAVDVSDQKQETDRGRFIAVAE